MHGVLTCLPTAAAVQDLQRLFYKILNCGLSHENEPPPMLVFNLVAPQMSIKLAPRGAWLRQKSCQEISCSRLWWY